MIVPRILNVAALILLSSPADLSAQTEPPVGPGDRVRVIELDTSLRPVFGTVLEFGRDTLVLQAEGYQDPMNLALASLERIDVRRGKRSNTRSGAIWGSALGGIAGGVVAVTAFGEDCGTSEHTSEMCAASGAAVFGAGLLIGGVVGAGVGALIGSSTKSDIWVNVPLDELSIGPTPTAPGGVAILTSLRL